MKFSLFFATGLFALSVVLSLPAVAQPSTGGPTPGSPDHTAVPLDGDASLLLAGGVAYGIRQIRACRLARRASRQARHFQAVKTSLQ